MRHDVDQSGSRDIICREIEDHDRDAVAALLTVGFQQWRKRAFWDEALVRLSRRAPPANLPKMGYLLESHGAVVGVLLVIASEAADGSRYCNLSSWYVAPAFSLYGALLVKRALRHQDVTVLNVTPAPETWELLAAQGYKRYSAGRSFTLPVLARGGATGAASRVNGTIQAGSDLTDYEAAMLQEHARWGCLSLVVVGAAGRVPFIFGLRRRRGIIPFAYLLYCRSLETFTAHAHAIGRYLIRHGVVLVVVDVDAKLVSIPGWFLDDSPKFFIGTNPPAAHDLTNTERAVFGV